MKRDVKKRSDKDATEVVTTGGASPIRLRRMSLFISKGPGQGSRVPVTATSFTVGKDPDCDLVFDERTVSRQHLRIDRKGESFTVTDLDSTNGTMVNGTRIKEAFLAPGSTLTAGTVELIFQAVFESPSEAMEVSDAFGDLIAASPAMKSIMGLMRKASIARTTVLLQGETGVGKSALARAIHNEGPRAKNPFVTFDCGSVPPTLIESELFGAEKGAYTGSVKSRPGVFEQAQKGTVFLDEIEDLPLELQSKLLRVLEEREIRRLGSTKPIPVDVQIIAASKADLQIAIEEGHFRSDLYYRIAVICVKIPPLRERHEDIPLLCDHFLKETQGPQTWSRLTPALREQLESYSWPGNLRELRNVLERIQCIGPDEFSGMDRPQTEKNELNALSFDLNRPFKEIKEELIDTFEKEYLERLLARSSGRVAPAAREAGLNRKYFYDLLKKHGLHGRNQ